MIGAATLLTAGLMKYYGLSEMYYGILFAMFNWVLHDGNWLYHYDYLCVIIMICWILYNSNADKVRYKMTVYLLTDMYRFWTYIVKNNCIPVQQIDTASFSRDQFSRDQFGNGDLFTLHREHDYDSKVYYKDDSFGVHGFFQWKCKKITISSTGKKSQKYEKEHHQDYIELSIMESKCDIQEYFKTVVKDDHFVEYRLYNEDRRSHALGIVSTLKLDADKCIGSFIHKQKKSILAKIKIMRGNEDAIGKLGFNTRPQMIFHGPSGTGKSSFCHLIARIVDKHIFEVNLMDYFVDKKGLFKLSKRGLFGWDRDRYVLILHGFDAVVDRIYFNMINGCHNGELTFEDLVESFNNQIFNNGPIIIATTDKFEEMNAKCPELFRYGRIQPVKFDYADDWFLGKLTKHHYKTKTKISITDKNIAPSVLVNMVVQSKAQNNCSEFDYFEQALNEYLC